MKLSLETRSLRRRTLSFLAVAAATALLTGACRQDMHDQPRIKPLAENDFFANGSGARPIPPGTVARGELHADKALYTGRMPDGSLVTKLPIPLTRATLERGHERFNIFCSPCHGRTGNGDGMVVQRGYKQPPSYHIARLRMAPVGYFFYIMSNGFGVMPSYAPQIPVRDRWAIAAYVRTLQLSQHFDASKLTPGERAKLDASERAPATGEASEGEAH